MQAGAEKAPSWRVARTATVGNTLRPGTHWSSRKRWELWNRSSFCASCGHLLDWPSGFELDHIIPLEDGGSNDDANLQLLCVYTLAGKRGGCHSEKSQRERIARDQRARNGSEPALGALQGRGG